MNIPAFPLVIIGWLEVVTREAEDTGGGKGESEAAESEKGSTEIGPCRLEGESEDRCGESLQGKHGELENELEEPIVEELDT